MAWIAWALLSLQETKPELENARLFVYDAAKGLSFKVLKDGAVELRTSKGTLEAPSWEEFRRRHAAAVTLHDLGHWMGGRAANEWELWIERQREEMEELRRLLRNAPDREFGVRVETPEEALRDQLGLKEGEGLIVVEVKPGTAAAKAGLRKHDLVTTLDGRAVGDRWAFRRDVQSALEKGFELGLLRAGKRELVKVSP